MIYKATNKILLDEMSLGFADYNAGALTSLNYRGKEYVDDLDHGRQWQSAFSIGGEIWNPTEAGGSYDGHNPSPSSSVVKDWSINQNKITTDTQMAFWLPVNGTKLSNSFVRKNIRIEVGYLIWETIFKIQPNIIGHCVMEVLTGYMPPEFNKFYRLVNKSAVSVPTAGDIEKGTPGIIATADGNHAVCARTIGIPQNNWDIGYGLTNYLQYGCTKWNTVFRTNNPTGEYKFITFVAIGTLHEVVETTNKLMLLYK
jgi:hypothetical protein